MRLLDRAWPFVTTFAGALAGAWLGARLPRPDPGHGPAPAGAEAPAPGPVPPPGPGGPVAVRASLDPLERALLVAELARALGTPGGGAGSPRSEPAPAPASAEAMEARRGAEQVLERARGAGEWTEADAHAIRTLLPRLTPGDHQGFLLSLTRMLNEGRVVMRTEGPPF